MKRGQSAWQLCLNEGNVREADFVRESYTAAQKRVQRSTVSCCVHVAIGSGGAMDRMRTNSFFSYGGNRRWAEEGDRRNPAGGDVTMKTHVRDGIWIHRLAMRLSFHRNVLTISDNLARAGNNVGGASFCRSIASSTRMKRHRGSLLGYWIILTSSTVNCANVSHRRGTSSHCSASATCPTILSNRCRPVMHCTELTTTAWSPPEEASLLIFVTMLETSCETMADFPVAVAPWTTRFRQGAASGYDEGQ